MLDIVVLSRSSISNWVRILDPIVFICNSNSLVMLYAWASEGMFWKGYSFKLLAWGSNKGAEYRNKATKRFNVLIN